MRNFKQKGLSPSEIWQSESRFYPKYGSWIGDFIRNMAVENIIRDKKGIQSGHKMPCLSRKFEK